MWARLQPISGQSELPISARPPSYGTRTPANRSITRSYGSAAVLPNTAMALKAKGLVDTFRKKTGLVIDAYFSANED